MVYTDRPAIIASHLEVEGGRIRMIRPMEPEESVSVPVSATEIMKQHQNIHADAIRLRITVERKNV